MSIEFSNHSNKLNLLRATAVSFVLVSHLPATENFCERFFGSNNFDVKVIGIFGVAIFFVHTCFVLMLSLDRQIRSYGLKNHSIEFFIKRIFRIYPLSMVTVLSVTFIAFFIGKNDVNQSVFFSNLFLIQNITGDPSNPGTLWSLPFEVQMYLILPLLHSIVNNNKKIAPFIVFSLWCSSILTVLVFWGLAWNYELIKFLPMFLPGVLAYSMLDTKHTISNKFLTASIFIFALLVPTLTAHGFKVSNILWFCCLVIGILIPTTSDFRHTSITSIAGIIAKYSFGIYLVHAPLVHLSFEYLENYSILTQWIVFIFGTASLSYLSFHIIEKPCINFGLRIVKLIQSN